jgi:hypothetical protein
MKRWVLLFVATLCFSAVASAQAEDNPRLEGFVGYSYLHFEDPGDYLGIPNGIGALRANLNGGSASIAFNPFKYLGVVADFGGYGSGNNSQLGGSTIYTYMFGPRVALRTGRFTPFAQFLGGGAHLTAGGGLTSGAWAGGVGLDANLTQHLGVRLFQVEYLRTYFTDGITDQQNSIRASAGLVVRF